MNKYIFKQLCGWRYYLGNEMADKVNTRGKVIIGAAKL